MDTKSHHDREIIAESAYEQLPHGGREETVLRVICGSSHHVATVYTSPVGLIYRAPVRSHSHGERDLPDEPHGDQHPHVWTDLLDADHDQDELPAWCDCGHRSLSRAAVLGWVQNNERQVVID